MASVAMERRGMAILYGNTAQLYVANEKRRSLDEGPARYELQVDVGADVLV
jgi:hypothetical protein